MFREAGDLLVVERRLIHAALAFPRLAIAGEQAISSDRADGGGAAGVLVVVGGAFLEHLLDVVRMVEQMHDLRP